MQSDSAYNNSATQSRFRIGDPNATPRHILVVALDARSRNLWSLFAGQGWHNVRFVNFDAPPGPATLPGDWSDAAAEGSFDMVVMVGRVGYTLDLAREVGSYCVARGIKVGAVLLGTADADEGKTSLALQQLRPWARILTLTQDAEYLPDILHALGG